MASFDSRALSCFETTVDRLTQSIQQRGLKLSAVIDHSADASEVALAMPPTSLFIFGNPLAGTPVMLASPSVAIDLPLKVLLQEDEEGVWISYNSPVYLQERHGFSEEMMQRLEGIRALCEEVAK